MSWRLPRCIVRLALVTWLFVWTVGALHADEVGVIDWHHKLIGTPLEGSTFLHKPVTGSGALAYTLTDRNVIAALNLRDGAIVWRQLLDYPKLARPVDGSIAVLSGINTTILTTFDAQTGHQLEQSFELSGSPLDVEILSPDWPGDSSRDIVTLSSGSHLRRFHHQELVWESSASNVKGNARYIATSLSKIYVVYTLAHAKSFGVAVATFDSVTGNILETHVLDASLTSEMDLQVVGSHSAAPLAIWSEKGKIKVNILGSKPVTVLSPERDFTSFSALAPHSSTSLPHFLISYSDSSSSWATAYHINLSSGSITAAYSLPKGPKGTYSLAQVDANVYFGKVTIEPGRNEADFEVWGSPSHARLARWNVPFPVDQYGLAESSVLDVVARGESVAARAMITAQDGSIHLLRNNEHSWTREESLAHTIPEYTLFLDLPVPEPKVHLNVATGNLLSAYINRVSTHIKQLRDLPSGLKTFARHFATGRYEEIEIGSTNRDAFGLRKFIIIATETGKLVAVDSANHGNIVWTYFIGKGADIYGMWILRESSAVRGQPPLIGVLVDSDDKTEFLQINGLDGTVSEKEPAHLDVPNIAKAFSVPIGVVDEQGRRPVVVIPTNGPAKVFPGDGNVKSRLSTMSDKLYYSVQGASAIQGYFFDTETLEGVPTWRFEIPAGSHLASVSSRSADEKVASIGRVLGDRSVLYKYLNPHLLTVAVANPKQLSLTIYLVDNVSGQILHELKHTGVDTSKGVETHVAENVVYWTYFTNGHSAGQSRGGRITVGELYESREKNERFNTTEWTSFGEGYPRVIAQTYLFEHPVSALTTTSTRHGITSRDLLVATTQQLIALPKRLLDPRRPVLHAGGKIKGDEKEEGLLPYEPVIPDERKWTISHMNELFGITRIQTSPALLESTSLVLGSGLDLFYTRVAPSGSFDVLSESFSKSQLLATIFALAAGVIVMRPIVRRKVLRQRWGER